MNKPLQPEHQCPSCHLQSIGPICGGQKRRINKNEKDEYFKAVDCTLWIERRIEETVTGEKRCPTCGQVIIIHEAAPVSPEAWAHLDQTPRPEVQKQMDKAIESVIFNWGDSVLEQQGVPELQEKANAEAKAIVKTVTDTPSAYEPPDRIEVDSPPPVGRRRGFKDMPKAHKRKKEVAT